MSSSALRTFSDAKEDASTEYYNLIIEASTQYSVSKKPEDLAAWEAAILDFKNSHDNLSVSKTTDVWLNESIWLLEFMRDHLMRIQECREQQKPKHSTDFLEALKKITALARPVKKQADEEEKKSDIKDYWSDLVKVIDAAELYYADEVPDADKLTAWSRTVIMKLAFIINYDATHGIETLYGPNIKDGPKDIHLTQRIDYLTHKISQLNTARNLLSRVKEIQTANAAKWSGYLSYIPLCSVWGTTKVPEAPRVDDPTKTQAFR